MNLVVDTLPLAFINIVGLFLIFYPQPWHDLANHDSNVLLS